MVAQRRRGSIYAVVDATRTPRYVGMTVATCEHRFLRHLQGIDRDDLLTRHLPFHRWLAKHRDEAQVIELESGEWTKTELGKREVEWINYFGSETLLNVAAGGFGGWTTGGTREQALRAWETRRARGTDRGWKLTPEQRENLRGRSPSGSWSVQWRRDHPEQEQARRLAVADANQQRDHHWAEIIMITCKCGCETELRRTPSNALSRPFANRSHYLRYVQDERAKSGTIIECRCGCGAQMLRQPSSINRHFVDRDHYLAYLQAGRAARR